MNSRERLLASVRHKEPDRVPIDLGGTSSGIQTKAYDDLKKILGFNGETKTFIRDHVEIDESVLKILGIDTRYIRVKSPKSYKLIIEEDNSYVDLWGTRWKKPTSSFYYEMVDYPIK